MGLYTVLKPCLKGENKRLKMIWNLNFSKNIDFFQKVKNLFWWNILKQHAQWFSCKVVLSYFNKIRTSKICSMVKRLSNPMHAGGSSSFNKKEWVKKEWPMCNWAITVSSFLFFRGQHIHSFNTGNILAQCSSSSLSCISPRTYISTSGFTSFFNLSITMMGIFIFYSPPPPNRLHFYQSLPSMQDHSQRTRTGNNSQSAHQHFSLCMKSVCCYLWTKSLCCKLVASVLTHSLLPSYDVTDSVFCLIGCCATSWLF